MLEIPTPSQPSRSQKKPSPISTPHLCAGYATPRRPALRWTHPWWPLLRWKKQKGRPALSDSSLTSSALGWDMMRSLCYLIGNNWYITSCGTSSQSRSSKMLDAVRLGVENHKPQSGLRKWGQGPQVSQHLNPASIQPISSCTFTESSM